MFWLHFVWTNWGGGPRPNEMALFAASFFYLFMVVQFVTIALLTPAYTAGAIAEEKERKTLEFLLATDLRNREIVLGKLAARVFNLTLLILVGLPILCFLQLLGGVEPSLMIAGFAVTIMTMVSLAGLSIFNSVLTRKPRDAITLTYLGGFAYLLLSLACWMFFTQSPLGSAMAAWGLHAPFGWNFQVTVGDLAEWFGAGNIVLVLMGLDQTLGTGRMLDDSLPPVLRGYLLFHGILATATIAWAVLRLRTVARKGDLWKSIQAAAGSASLRPAKPRQATHGLEGSVRGALAPAELVWPALADGLRNRKLLPGSAHLR